MSTDSNNDGVILMTRERSVALFRQSLAHFMKRLKTLCDKHGLFSEEVEECLDTTDGLDVRRWHGCDAESEGDEIVGVIDEAIDGYIVQKRVPADTVRNKWVAQIIGDSLYITWIDSRGWTSVMFHDRLDMEKPKNDVIWDYLRTCGVYPIKTNYLPIPSKSKMVDEEDEG